VLLRRSGTFPDTSLLLDGTPGGSAGWEADLQTALPVGTTVPLADGQFSVVVQGLSAGGATVQVVPTPPATAPAPAPVDSGAGEVLPAEPAADTVAAPAAAEPAPVELAAAPVETGPPVTAELRAAADTSTGSGFVLAAVGALLAAATLIVARRLRRIRVRTR
jgi:hypothetical protein